MSRLKYCPTCCMETIRGQFGTCPRCATGVDKLEIDKSCEERKAAKERELAADRDCYAAHVASAQKNGDLEGEQSELTFGMDCDGAIYSFASDRSGVTVRCTEPCDTKLQIVWIPNSLFGAMRRAMAASQEDRS